MSTVPMSALAARRRRRGRSTRRRLSRAWPRGRRAERLVHVHEVPARPARTVDWPAWVDPAGVCRVRRRRGRPRCGRTSGRRPTSPTTGRTSSSRPAPRRARAWATSCRRCRPWSTEPAAPSGRGATALYLSPTKALAADQLARMEALAVPGCARRPTTATPPPRSAGGSATTPTSSSPTPTSCTTPCCPRHERWAPFLRALRYVVVDECHVYRGVFGSHLAALLRRLRRVVRALRRLPHLRARLGDRARPRRPRRAPPRDAGARRSPRTASPREAMTFGAVGAGR